MILYATLKENVEVLKEIRTGLYCTLIALPENRKVDDMLTRKK